MKEKVKIGFKDMGFWYGSKQILSEVNLKFYSKKITALIGPSGCGKSTLIRCINRMNDLVPTAKIDGRIIYNNEDIYGKNADVIELRKKIGMVFQKPNPFPMSIFENVAYGLRIQNMKDKNEIARIVKKSLEKADLWNEVKDCLSRSAFGLSGGQQQRLCIARTLANDPEVVLLDEPCSSLDPIATAKIEVLLKKIKREKTIIIVTHNMQQAKRISDYSCYLLNGKIIEYSKTENMFTHPKNKLTKDYLDGRFG